MKKKACLVILFINIIILISICYPIDLIEIIGDKPLITNNTKISIHHWTDIMNLESRIEKISKSSSDDFYNYIESFKFTRTNTPYKKLDDKEMYTITMKNGDEEIFHAAIRGNKYFSVRDKNGDWKLYKVYRNDFDFNILEKYYNE